VQVQLPAVAAAASAAALPAEALPAMLQRAGRIGVSTAIHRLSPAVPLVMAVALAGIIQLGLCQLLCGAWVSADAAAAAAVHFYEP
jgi:hypothetical protein